ncbi:35539_t:CDS:2 [Gigaspora margarita]|uniref:35539_t:CDS:1 n=1 Tax=Gigaspora margarita TaxID=4874 RepID=A0ABN7UXQ0_GIGMA|nr:35539_t:CDS:2 [Gigaspora margarita]
MRFRTSKLRIFKEIIKINAEQFKEFMEMMTRSLESQNGRSKLSDLKKRIDEMALNYAALTGKIKDALAIPKNKTSNSIEVYGPDRIISKFKRLVTRNYTPAWFGDKSEDK